MKAGLGLSQTPSHQSEDQARAGARAGQTLAHSRPLFPQVDGQSELKASEEEKAVPALPPKQACQCHKEDLAKTFAVRAERAPDTAVVRFLGEEKVAPPRKLPWLCVLTHAGVVEPG